MVDYSVLWQKTKQGLEEILTPTLIKICFSKTKILAIEKNGQGTKVALGFPNKFLAEQVEKRCLLPLVSALEKTLGEKVDLSLKVADFKTPKTEGVLGGNGVNEIKNQTLHVPQEFTFEKFIVGESNKLAYSASAAVAKNPGLTYNPLFIWGGTGLGKTHLLKAIAKRLEQGFANLKVIYLTTEAFTNEFVNSLGLGQIKTFREKFRKANVLLIDDVHFLSGKPSTQDEFFHTFNELYSARQQIVLTSDKHPAEIGKLEQRLVSRFLGGLTVDIGPPELELKMAILATKAAACNLDLDSTIVEFLARLVSNPREIEGVVVKLGQLHKLESQLTTENIKSFFTKKQASVRTNPKQVISQVAKFYGLKATQIIGRDRKKELVRARQMVMFLLRNELGLSFSFIGQLLGGKDHSTIIHGVEVFEKVVGLVPTIREDLFEVKRSLSF